jgi:ATP-dependent helicase/nuclease subunit A
MVSSPREEAVTARGKNVCVTAGAGSGKTSLLIDRFLRLAVSEKASPERIVAITYTDKAASELKERLVRAFRDRGLFDERRALENAYIGTIHSFAARLLRENPFEAGVDPHFAVLEPGQSQILMDQVLEEWLDEAAARADVFELLATFGEEKIRESLQAVHRKLRALGKELDETSPLAPKPEAGALWSELVRLLRSFAGARSKGGSDTAENNWNLAETLLPKLPRPGDRLSWEAISELAHLAKGFKAFGKQGAAVKQIRQAFGEAAGLEMEKAGAPLAEAFRFLYHGFASRFEARKRDAALLDFDDLLVKAYRLFRGEDDISREMRRRYQDRFEAILVDEFQDTNGLQAQWIDLLARGDNLFIVGDPKQSIYRFRYADLAAFLAKEKAFAGDPKCLRHSLNENHRSRPEILEFVNHLFERLWAEDGFPFERLAAKRPFAPKSIPSIELLILDQGDADEDETLRKARVREARALAHRLKEIVEGKLLQLTERDGTVRDIAYGDIAVLFRAMTDSSVYENELRELDIPYFVVRGRGFYERQEIADLVNFLASLERPDLDIPLAAVLRSPLVGLSEEALYWLSRVKEGGEEIPLEHGLADHAALCELREGDRERLGAFRELFARFRARKDKWRIADMLSGLVAATRYDAKILGTPAGMRKYANVKKLIDIARDFETREAFGLREFIAYIKKLEPEEARESEAQVELEKGDTVKLLTIHKAKGLEFPLVVLADLARKQEVEDGLPFNFTEEYGLAFRVKNEFFKSSQDTYTFAKNAEFEREKNAEEAKRLFYVALTRAEEHLILSGVNRGNEHREKPYRELPTWMDWLRKALEDAAHLPLLVLETKENGKAWKKRQALREMAPFRDALAHFRPIGPEALARLLDPPPGAASASELLKRASIVRKDYYETRDLAVSALLKYEDCPGCYFDVYEMRAPEERGAEVKLAEDGEEDLLPRREFGNLFHRILQHFDLQNPFESELARRLAEVKNRVSEAEYRELERSVRNFFRSEWGEKLKKCEVYRELPFLYKTPRGEISGQIDLACKTPEGSWIVLDYKTSRVATPEEIESAASKYRLQILLYGLAFRDIGGIHPEKGLLYFSAPNRFWMLDMTERALAGAREKTFKMVEAIALAKERLRHREGCPNGRILRHGA